jgi:hypothetical protein
VALLTKESNAKTLKELEGVITAEVLTPPEPILTIDNIMKAATGESARKGEYQFEVVDRSESNGQIRLRIRVQMPIRNDFVAFQGRGGLVIQGDGIGGGQAQIQLRDASGKAISTTSMQLMEQSFDGITQTSLYSFAISKKASPAPASFAVVGRRLATVEVPFALKNVLLP